MLLALLPVSVFAASRDEAITLKNWITHPRILEVKSLYRETAEGIKSGVLIVENRQYDITSSSCGTNPIRSHRLVKDKAGNIRMYGRVELASGGEPLTIDRYYDTGGALRFVTIGTIMASHRIYLDETGKVFWSLDKDFVKYRQAKFSNQDRETKPLKAEAAGKLFDEKQACPLK
ncbi:MAG: hypothetical protein OEZ10_10935 [Gammaproteobacteria bacterium]|nr:hypothetical protein [Gammaproteobacteria bacterium]